MFYDYKYTQRLNIEYRFLVVEDGRNTSVVGFINPVIAPCLYAKEKVTFWMKRYSLFISICGVYPRVLSVVIYANGKNGALHRASTNFNVFYIHNVSPVQQIRLCFFFKQYLGEMRKLDFCLKHFFALAIFLTFFFILQVSLPSIPNDWAR